MDYSCGCYTRCLRYHRNKVQSSCWALLKVGYSHWKGIKSFSIEASRLNNTDIRKTHPMLALYFRDKQIQLELNKTTSWTALRCFNRMCMCPARDHIV